MNTFFTQNQEKKTQKTVSTTQKNEEVSALLQMTQIMAHSCEVQVEKFIGEHECCKYSASLFDENGNMGIPNSKYTLVKGLTD